MGTCQSCYPGSTTEEISPIKTRNLKAGPQFNAINFTFTNRPMTDLAGNCLIFYADHAKQLNDTMAISRLGRKTRRKIFEYLTLAEQQAERINAKQHLIPISIPGVNFGHIMLVKNQPWDGGSKLKLETKIYQLTVGYLQSFKQNHFSNFTIVEFDSLSGIHYSLSFAPIAKALQEYCSEIKNVNILCNSVESIDYFYRKIRYYKEEDQNFDQLTEQRGGKDKKKKKSKNKNLSLF